MQRQSFGTSMSDGVNLSRRKLGRAKTDYRLPRPSCPTEAHGRSDAVYVSDMTDPGWEKEWERMSEDFLWNFHTFITHHFGVRCRDYDDGCACCRAWKSYDLF